MSSSNGSSIPHVDLDALVAPVATITLDGQKHDILPVQGDARISFEEIVQDAHKRQETGTPQDDVKYLGLATRIVRAVAPSVPAERVRTMTLDQLTKIIALSMGAEVQVRTVMAQTAGKGGGSTRKRKRIASSRR